jgi:exonuclease SbcC
VTKLSSITISNIRRFGADVTIGLSPGATVLLAPNGTGKTAFFEAIELALTGTVARLEGDLTPIIRDAHSNASVVLQFDDAQRTVNLRRGGQPVTTGGLTSVFGDTDQADIPFLLRLTHLLDQRERDWFVQADAKTAGSHLSRLPIGRDGTHANSVLTGARRSITETLNNASVALTKANGTLDDWNSLLAVRDASTEELERPLKPRAEIAAILASIAEALPGMHLPPITGLDSLDSGRDALLQVVTAKHEELQNRGLGIAATSGLISSYVSERERIARLELDRSNVIATLSEPHALIDRLSQDQVQHRAQLENMQLRYAALEQKISRAVDIARAKEELDRRVVEFEQAEQSAVVAEGEYSNLQERRQVVEQLVQLHQSFRSREQAIGQVESELAEANALLERWQFATEALVEVERFIEAAHGNVEEAGKAYQEAITLHANRERSANDARSRVQSIASTVDAMRQAVSLVAANIAPDREDCPVCGVVHGADGLRDRLQASLEAIDPALALAERDLHDATALLRQSEALVSDARTNIQVARTALAQHEARKTSLFGDIDAVRTNRLISAESIAGAKANLKIRSEQTEAARRALSTDVTNAPAAPSIGEVAEARSVLEQATLRLDSARRMAAGSSSELSRATRRYASFPPDSAMEKPIDQLSTDLLTIDHGRAEIEASLKRVDEAIDKQRTRLASSEQQLIVIDRDLAESRGRLASTRSAWRQLDLPGEPSLEVSSAVELQLNAERAALERRRAHLIDVGVELGRWRTTEKNRSIQSLIDSSRGQVSEAQRTEQLKANVAAERARIESLSKLSGALDSLATVLSAQIGDIHDSVVAIVPRWQALLKRIVRDQRFAQTELDFYSHYKKQHASVLVPLHGSTVSAPRVASEAQMTDLQLTFLLSMAVSHRWTSWRGLLLDDPTQHHDLVHAASVFDVLRDYVVEHGFQVVIATHDALQARFLMRKLQNDGVPSKLWTLVPTPDGVTATSEGRKRT